MAGGWARDDAVNEQIEVSTQEAIERMRLRNAQRVAQESAFICEECDEPIPEARRRIAPLALDHAARIERSVRRIAIKDQRSRWASCAPDGTLAFSWRLVMAPEWVLDYVVAHEVAHLREMNHGPKFWALCRELCPRTDEARAWLKRNGSALHAISFE